MHAGNRVVVLSDYLTVDLGCRDRIGRGGETPAHSPIRVGTRGIENPDQTSKIK